MGHRRTKQGEHATDGSRALMALVHAGTVTPQAIQAELRRRKIVVNGSTVHRLIYGDLRVDDRFLLALQQVSSIEPLKFRSAAERAVLTRAFAPLARTGT